MRKNVILHIFLCLVFTLHVKCGENDAANLKVIRRSGSSSSSHHHSTHEHSTAKLPQGKNSETYLKYIHP
jgi:hypothetical protein